MTEFKKQTRTPLLNALRKAFSIAAQSEQPGSAPVDELAEMQAAGSLHRRRFIGDMVKTGIAVGAAGWLNACSKVPDMVPPHALKSSGNKKGNQPKIVIIGAGIAGLNCAYQLQKAGYSAAIYEGATRAGGRIFTKSDLLAPGLYTELGGEFIDSDHKDMFDLCREFGLPLLDTLSKEELVYARDSFYIDGQFYSELDVIRAFKPYAARITADIASLPDDMTYDDYDEATLYFDQMSLHAYLDSIGMTGFIRKGIEVAYLTEYGLETEEQSAINFLFLFSPKTNQGFKIFGESDERYKVRGGNQSITNALYSRVENQVYLEHKLIRVEEDATGYTLYFSNQNGTVVPVRADMVVSTIPFTTLREVTLNVEFPQWKLNAIRNIGYGTNAKLLLGFNKRVWRKYLYSGYCFTNRQIQSGWDNSAMQPGINGGFTVYQGGIKGIALGAGTPEQQAPAFVQQLEQMWPGCGKAFNGNVKRMHWPSHPFTKGSYACYKVGQYTTIRGAEIKPIGNFYFAGEHCSGDYQGFMNGGAETGRMAAQSIVKAIKTGQKPLLV